MGIRKELINTTTLAPLPAMTKTTLAPRKRIILLVWFTANRHP